jgi:hypothetical protein
LEDATVLGIAIKTAALIAIIALAGAPRAHADGRSANAPMASQHALIASQWSA